MPSRYDPDAEHEAWLRLSRARRDVTNGLRALAAEGYFLDPGLQRLLADEAEASDALARLRLTADLDALRGA